MKNIDEYSHFSILIFNPETLLKSKINILVAAATQSCVQRRIFLKYR